LAAQRHIDAWAAKTDAVIRPHGRRLVERDGQLVEMVPHRLTADLAAAEQVQQPRVETVLAVIAKHIPGGEIAQAHGRVSERGDKDDVGAHAGGEHPCVDQLVPWRAEIETVHATLDPCDSTLAASVHLSRLGEPRRDTLMEPSRMSGRTGDDLVGAKARRQVVRALDRVDVGQLSPRQVRDLEQDAVVDELAELGRSRGPGQHHDDVDVGEPSQLVRARQRRDGSGEERPAECGLVGDAFGEPGPGRRARPGPAHRTA